jgi:RNA polymerase sigma factor (sigma-70 family)
LSQIVEDEMANSTKAQGRKLFEQYYPLVEEIIRFVSRRNRLGADEREDYTSYAMLKLVENDYARIRKYRGDSSFRTYLTVVMQRLFLDFRTAKWGKWRPSTAAKKLGAPAVVLETLLYRDGLDLTEAREVLLARPDTALSREAVWDLAIQLRRRPRAKLVDEEALDNVGVAGREELVVRRENEALMASVESRLVEASARLSEEERAILRMRFDEGKTVPEIAEALDRQPKALYAKIGRLLKCFRDALEANGVSWDELEHLVGLNEVGLDLDRVFGSSLNHQVVSV